MSVPLLLLRLDARPIGDLQGHRRGSRRAAEAVVTSREVGVLGMAERRLLGLRSLREAARR